MFDPVNKPAHYTQGRKFEPVDVIEDWELGFHLGNALKYIARAGRKDPALTSQDISKAIFYLERFKDSLLPSWRTPGRLADQMEELDLGDSDPWVLDEYQTLTTSGDLRSAQSRRADYIDQEEVEFQALGSIGFGSDEELLPFEPPTKDLTKFTADEIYTTWKEGSMILGATKAGQIRILKHSDDLYDQLPSDVEPSEFPVSDT